MNSSNSVVASSRTRSLPQIFEDYHNFHENETILVCGCGTSLNLLQELPPNLVTIGVNDIGRRFDPTYLVVLNGMSTFTAERKAFIQKSRALVVFSQLRIPLEQTELVRFHLGARGGTAIEAPGFTVPYTNNSPYVGICLARFMGAKRIGLIGVDFTEHHFFAQTGVHNLSGALGKMNHEYAALKADYDRAGIELFNLSPESRIDALPKIPLQSFLKDTPRIAHSDTSSKVLNIVSYATTPVAGVPSILARCIQEKTPHKASCVWSSGDYGNGVCYEGGVSWKHHPQTAKELLEAADLVIAHNGKVDRAHASILANKPVLTLAHNYKWNVDCRFFEKGQPGFVVSQYQATLDEFDNWIPVPNPIPLWEPAHQVGPKNHRITLCYTPSAKHERYSKKHRLYWHSKGYDTTMRILKELAQRYPIDLEVIRDRQISHAESLAMKLRSHIVIDECVTGSYHRNSLEGLAAGAVVVNGYGILPELDSVFRKTSFDPARIPFRCATLDSLETTLISLIESGVENLQREGLENRKWMETHWDFSRQWNQFWEPVIERTICSKTPSLPLKRSETKLESEIKEPTLSIVIPHGGSERLLLLKACLETLHKCAGTFELIIVEMGETPVAREIAEAFNAYYTFCENKGAFERARALNIGTGLAEGDYVLWMDNDVLLPKRFLAHALEEIQDRELDYIIPFTSIQYLTERDSQQVRKKVKALKNCTPQTEFTCHQNFGCIGLIKKAFFNAYGGLDEGFIGWGGEDNAWNHKVHLLGKAGSTRRLDQVVYHLFHPNSGATTKKRPQERNVHYNTNLRLMRRLARIRNPQQYLSQRPKPAFDSCPWNPQDAFTIFVSSFNRNSYARLAQAISEGLKDRYGIQVSITETEKIPNRVKAHHSIALGFSEKCSKAPNAGTCLFLQEDKAFPRSQENVTAHNVLPLSQIAGRKSDSEAFAALEQPHKIARTLSPKLSFLASKEARRLSEPDQIKRIRELNGHITWLYWEGPCPDWILRCRETLERYAPNLKLLNREQFDFLWIEDRDIDIDSLDVAHRADFARAYLLHEYGGLWIDSDCIAMKPLDPIFKLLETLEFVAHKEKKSKLYSNGFIAARPDSRIAFEFYKTVRETLRAGQLRNWLAIGGQALTNVLTQNYNFFHELQTEQIQPICWSQSERFYQSGTPETHTDSLHEASICYMLYNTAFKRHEEKFPNAQLQLPNTFFTFLLSKALESNQPHMTTQIDLPPRLRILREVAPQRLLDIHPTTPCWGLLAQEFANQTSKAQKIESEFTAIVPATEASLPLFLQTYKNIRDMEPKDFLSRSGIRWELIILSDISQYSLPDQSLVIDTALNHSNYVVVESTSDQAPPIDNPRYIVSEFKTKCSSNNEIVILLLSRQDLKRLNEKSEEERIFEEAAKGFQSLHSESLSGPGSSLHQTQTIRNALPSLFKEFGIKSIVDTPCGDFNWMQYVIDENIEYTGIDIVLSIIKSNQSQYGGEKRKFIHLDLTRDPIPQADLIFCRDMLVHLSYEGITRYIQNAKASGSQYLLTTTFGDPRINHDIVCGDWRPLNLHAEPFNFPTPMHIINEGCTEGNGQFCDKSLALWKLSDMPEVTTESTARSG